MPDLLKLIRTCLPSLILFRKRIPMGSPLCRCTSSTFYHTSGQLSRIFAKNKDEGFSSFVFFCFCGTIDASHVQKYSQILVTQFAEKMLHSFLDIDRLLKICRSVRTGIQTGDPDRSRSPRKTIFHRHHSSSFSVVSRAAFASVRNFFSAGIASSGRVAISSRAARARLLRNGSMSSICSAKNASCKSRSS